MSRSVTTEVERVARESYGRLVANLSLRFNDVLAAEDALGDAFESAMRTWTPESLPSNPEAWLFTVAKRRFIDGIRRQQTRNNARKSVRERIEETMLGDESAHPFQDHRLNLMFACAHPAIDSEIRAPLILNTILHLSAEEMSGAFLVKPTAMGQRLVRGKRKIRDAGIGFELPAVEDLPERLGVVLEAVYATFGVAWEDVAGGDRRASDLTEEAIWLGHLIVDRLPEEPEASGLLALMLYCDARKDARRDEDGCFVPLSDQDPGRWNSQKISKAEQLLRRASKTNRPGRFQLEASIQSAHSARIAGNPVNWEAISVLYEGLVRMAPTLGAQVGRASALSESHGAEAALNALEQLAHRSIESYQPYWTLKAHVLAKLGRTKEAESARSRAAGLTTDPNVRAHLLNLR